MPPCGFGNRLLYYYNLRQEAHKKGCDFFCVPWGGYSLFEGQAKLLGQYPPQQPYEIAQLALGEQFFHYSDLSTREIFKLIDKPLVESNTCAIHFRGTDFHSWNPNAILDYEYYSNSVDQIKDSIVAFRLFTDDNNLESYKKIKNKLDNEGLIYTEGQNTHDRQYYIEDFASMTECDHIISSPSTFCICAGFIGNVKKIIHCKKWVMDRSEKNDKFWIDLLNGGNNNYSVWRFI